MVDMINQWSASFRFGLHLLPFRIGLESSPIFLRFLPAGMLQNVDEQVLRIRRILGRPVTNALHVVSLEDRISVITKARLQNIIRIVRMQRRVDDAGSYGVKSNVLFCVFKSQASYDRVQTTFGDHWNGSWHSGDWVIRQCCADANNASTVFLRLHLLDRELCDGNEAGEVG